MMTDMTGTATCVTPGATWICARPAGASSIRSAARPVTLIRNSLYVPCARYGMQE